MTSEFSTSQKLRRSVDVLLGRGWVQLSSNITADAVHAFFEAKINCVRSFTSGRTPRPALTDAPPGCSLMDFMTLSVDDITPDLDPAEMK
jgi:hypothetical protein